MTITLGLDIGTTSTIGILIDADRGVLATASRPTELFSPHPGWAEEEPGQWWDNACAVCRELIASAGIAPGDVAGVGVTGMLPAVVLLDRDGAVLRRSIQQSDGRTAAEVAEIAGEVDAAAFLRRTGCGVNQQLVAPKLRWLRRHEPEVWGRVATVLGSYDHLVFRLTGERSLERNWALESGFYDLGLGGIAPDLAALGGLPPAALPPVRASHEVVGRVTPGAAAATGLAAGTPVVAGCADHVASAYVAGVRRPGDLLIKFGGAGDILLATAEPVPDARLFLDFHIVPGLYMPNGCMAASGSLLNWFARELAGRAADTQDGLTLHQRLDALAEAVPAAADGLVMLPYMLGEKTPIHDPNARGTLVGLGLHHTLGHLWRAALEAVAYGFRHHVEVMTGLGYPVARVLASDGGASSRVWMRIAADVLQRPVHLLEGHPGSCLGAAIVAAFGIGALDGWDAVDRFVSPAGTVVPDPAVAARYDAAYGLYRDLYAALKPLYPRFAALSPG